MLSCYCSGRRFAGQQLGKGGSEEDEGGAGAEGAAAAATPEEGEGGGEGSDDGAEELGRSLVQAIITEL